MTTPGCQDHSSLMSNPVYITFGLLQLCVVCATRYNLEQILEDPEYVCTLNIKKRKKGKHHGVSERPTLVTNQTENSVQNINSYT